MQRTPGPWQWQFIGTLGAWRLVGSDGSLVQWGGSPDSPLSPDQVALAAVPDLLYVLRNIVADLPIQRPWLDPMLEAQARSLLRLLDGPHPTMVVLHSNGTEEVWD